ncbi:hypothetical protein TWF694_003003 [Orbilia ellipsospora]|uniref:Pectinesterase n=1 Tax=Orbilia ellipsospora TaxID=2528407 RepID=A0AAV9X0C8_9PEZI
MQYKYFAALAALLPLALAQSPVYGQCGGIGWTGPTTCVSGSVCTYGNDYYYQCLPGTGTTLTTTKTTTKATTTTTKASTTSAPATTAGASGSVHTAPPSGAIIVRQSGTKSGEFATLGAAIASLGTSSTAAVTIFIYQGTYNERVVINYKGILTIIGYTTNSYSYTSNTVTFQNSLGADVAGSDANSATLQCSGANLQVYNLNIKNTRGSGVQAVAMSSTATKSAWYGCAFYGYQDTLYANSGYQYYANCYIEGAVDYIFGGAAAWFNKCTLRSNGGGAITANSRSVSTDPNWYVFESCSIDKSSASSIGSGSVYLGRPWKVLARVLYQRCTMSNIINAAGWTTMAAGATPLFYEYMNTGAGASTSGRKYLTSTSVSLTKAQLFANDVSWYDASYPV